MARKMSLDMRMISQEYTDHIDNKASHCAKMISEYYWGSLTSRRGHNLYSLDLGTYKPNEWSVYPEIKRKLTEDYGIPSSEVRFIQEARRNERRKRWWLTIVGGASKVYSTEMLGTGVNAQQRAVAVYHRWHALASFRFGTTHWCRRKLEAAKPLCGQ